MNQIQEQTHSIDVKTGQTVTHFRLVKRLGEGGMGTVYLAEDITLSRQVAIKFMNRSVVTDMMQQYPDSSDTIGRAVTEALEQRFIREAKSAAQISHPNLAQIYEANFESDDWFIAMEYIDGKSLEQLLADADAVFSPDEIMSIAKQTIAGLQHAWDEYKIVHRDIKPGNIMVLKNGAAKIVDLGLAKPTDSEAKQKMPDVTEIGMPVGTPQYMSPEQARGDATIDYRTDVFSLGVTLYELCTGQQAYEALTPAMLYDAQMRKAYKPIRELQPKIPVGLADLVDRMLEPELDKRSMSYADVLTQIERLETPQEPPPVPERPLLAVVGDAVGIDLVRLFPLERIFSSAQLSNRMTIFCLVFGLLPLALIWLHPGAARTAWLVSIYFAGIWGAIAWRSFRPRREVRRAMLSTSLITGAIGVAVVMALLQLPLVRRFYEGEFIAEAAPKLWQSIVFIGLFEGGLKLLPLIILGAPRRVTFSSRDYLLIGTLCGVVFSVKHGIAYSLLRNDYAFGNSSQVMALLVFLLAVPLLHGMWTGIAAWFLGQAREQGSKPWAIIGVGLVVTAVLHGVYITYPGSWPGMLAATLSLFAYTAYAHSNGQPEAALNS